MSTYLHYICRTRIKKGTTNDPKAADSALSIVLYFRARARVRSYRVKLFNQSPRQGIQPPCHTQPPPYALLRPMMVKGKPLDAIRDLF